MRRTPGPWLLYKRSNAHKIVTVAVAQRGPRGRAFLRAVNKRHVGVSKVSLTPRAAAGESGQCRPGTQRNAVSASRH